MKNIMLFFVFTLFSQLVFSQPNEKRLRIKTGTYGYTYDYFDGNERIAKDKWYDTLNENYTESEIKKYQISRSYADLSKLLGNFGFFSIAYQTGLILAREEPNRTVLSGSIGLVIIAGIIDIWSRRKMNKILYQHNTHTSIPAISITLDKQGPNIGLTFSF